MGKDKRKEEKGEIERRRRKKKERNEGKRGAIKKCKREIKR